MKVISNIKIKTPYGSIALYLSCHIYTLAMLSLITKVLPVFDQDSNALLIMQLVHY